MDVRSSISTISVLVLMTVALLSVKFFIPNSCVAQQFLSSTDISTPPVERRFEYRFHRPPTFKHGRLTAQITGIGRSEGGFYDGSRFLVHIAYTGVPKGFIFNEDSVEAVDSLGNRLNPGGYFDTEIAFELPEKPFSGLREFSGSFDNSYVTKRKYGPYTMETLKESLVFKDRRGAISVVKWQVMNIPYDMIAGSYVRLTMAGGTESLFKRLPDEQHGYFVLRCYAIEKDVMDKIADAKVSVYGSDGRWHDAIAQWNDINSPCGDFTSGATYLGFRVGLDLLSSGKAPAKVVSVDGPGKKAGIKVEDVITKLGSTKVSNQDEALGAMSRGIRPGIPTPITVLRDGRQIELEIIPSGNPIWNGMSADAGTKVAQTLGRLVGAGRDWRICALAFVFPDPVSRNFKPLKVKLVHGEKVNATKTIPFKFRNIQVPANFWSAKMKAYN